MKDSIFDSLDSDLVEYSKKDDNKEIVIPIAKDYSKIFQSLPFEDGIQIIGFYRNINIENYKLLKIPEYICDKAVKKVSWRAFSNNIFLEEVVLPNTIIEIGDSAFSECSNLKSIRFSRNLKTIGSKAFFKCISLTTCNLPDDITEIKASTFEDCANLINIQFPQKVERIGDNSFCNCSSLKFIKIPNTAIYIGSYAFKNCFQLIKVDCDSEDLYINSSSFEWCNNLMEVNNLSNLRIFGDLLIESDYSINSFLTENLNEEKIEDFVRNLVDFRKASEEFFLEDWENPFGENISHYAEKILFFHLGNEFKKLKLYELAEQAYKKSASRYNFQAYYELGGLYFNGFVGVKNIYEAEKCLYQAARFNNEKAKILYDKVIKYNSQFKNNSAHYFLRKIYELLPILKYENEDFRIELLTLTEYFFKTKINHKDFFQAIYNHGDNSDYFISLIKKKVCLLEQKTEIELSMYKLQEAFEQFVNLLNSYKEKDNISTQLILASNNSSSCTYYSHSGGYVSLQDINSAINDVYSENSISFCINDDLILSSWNYYDDYHQSNYSAFEKQLKDRKKIIKNSKKETELTDLSKDDFSLDFTKIQTIQTETNRLSEKLDEIFTEEQIIEQKPFESEKSLESNSKIKLSEKNRNFLQKISTYESIERKVANSFAKELGLMLDGVMETINNLSFDLFDDSLFEEDDLIYINQEYAKEILSKNESSESRKIEKQKSNPIVLAESSKKKVVIVVKKKSAKTKTEVWSPELDSPTSMSSEPISKKKEIENVQAPVMEIIESAEFKRANIKFNIKPPKNVLALISSFTNYEYSII